MLTKSIPNNKIILLLALSIAYISQSFLIVHGGALPISIFFVGIFFLLLSFANAYLPLLILLLCRSSLDLLKSSAQFNIGTSYININAMLTILVIVMGISFIMVMKLNVMKLPIVSSFILFLFIILLNLPISIVPINSLADLLRLTSVLMFYVLMSVLIKGKDQIKQIIFIIVLSSLLPLSIGTYQFITNTGSLGAIGYNRLMGTFVHPNVFGMYLVFLTPITIFSAKYAKRNVSRLLYIGLSLWMVFLLIQTYTRSPWIGLLIVGLVFGLKKDKRTLLLTTIIIGVILVLFPEIVTRFTETHPGRQSSVVTRILTWKASFDFFKDRPLFGWGLGSFQFISFLVKLQAHNDYIRILVEMGIVGFIFFINFYYKILKHLSLSFRKINDPYFSDFVLIVFSIFVANLAMCFVSNPFGFTVIQWYLFTLIALVDPILRLESDRLQIEEL